MGLKVDCADQDPELGGIPPNFKKSYIDFWMNYATLSRILKVLLFGFD